jgi:hypothetical protein
MVPNHPGLMKNLLLAEEAVSKPTPPEP